MTFTYDPTQLATSLKDRVRFDLHDVDASDILLQDEEITGLITIATPSGGGTASRAVVMALAARAIANRFATDALSSVGSLGFDVSTRVTHWEGIAQYWEKRAGALGLSLPKVRPPIFRLGQMDDHQPAGGGVNLAPEDFQPQPMPDTYGDPLQYYFDDSGNLQL